MQILKECFRRAAMLLRGERFDRDLAEELAFHRAMQAEENEREGLSPRDARDAAARRLGNDLALREESRDEWGWAWLDRVRADLRYALRSLRHNPGYTAAATATLALAIGANCLMFAVADNLVLRPFPYPHPERLVFLWSSFERMPRTMVSFPDYLDYQARNTVFESMGADIYTSYDIDAGGYPEKLTGRRATASFFTTLGVGARLGRLLTAEDERPGAAPVVVIGETCWRTRFHADPRIIGKTLRLSLNDQPHRPFTVVGVLPRSVEAAYRRGSEVWSPFNLDSEDAHARNMGGFEVLARIKPGVTLASAADQMRVIGATLPRYGRNRTGAAVASFQENLIGDTGAFMAVLLGAVGFVLLLACANVANLALARGAEREREMTIRAAIGASRGRLFRQILTESVVLALIGGATGALIASAGARWIRTLAPDRTPRADQIAVDGRVLLFTLALALVTGVVFGLAPAFRGSRVQLNPALNTVRGGSRRHGLLRSALVTAEVALGFMLVTGAGLMINSFVRLLLVDPGFSRSALLFVETHASRQAYPDPVAREAAVEDVLARIRAIPGVRFAGVSDGRPLGNVLFNQIAHKDSDAGPALPFKAESIAGDYFAAIGTPLLRGRTFTSADSVNAAPVALVNSLAATRYWPGEGPIGKTLVIGAGKDRKLAAIVGIVGDVRRGYLERAPEPAFYVPRAQKFFADHLDLVVQPEPGVPAAPLAPIVRARMAAVSSSFAADTIETAEAVMREQLARPRFAATVFGIFGFLALALTATGVYGVTAYTVRARRHEIGVRIALGADRRRVFSLFLRRSGRAVAIGLALGFAGALAATRVLTRLLYEVKPTDAPTFAAVAVLLAGFALAGSYIPARRAARVDPMESVRCD